MVEPSRAGDAAAAPPPSRELRRPPPPQVAWLRNRGMAMLLLSLVVTVFVIPAVLPYGESERMIVDVAMMFNMIIGVLAISDHRKTAGALVVLILLATVARWGDLRVSPALLPTLRELPTMAVLLVLSIAVGMNVFGARRAVLDRILGAVVLYMLIGLGWAVVYAFISAHTPGAFSGAVQGNGVRDWVYFSFATLTTVGFGDIAPVARAARSTAVLEALVGQLYPAIVLARVVSLSRKEGTAADERP